MTFELHAEMAEQKDLKKCIFQQFSELQNPRNLDIDLGSGQDHISMHNNCSTTSVPNHVTLYLKQYGNMAI